MDSGRWPWLSHDAVDGDAGFGSFWEVAEQSVFAADGEVADGAITDAVLRALLL